MESIPKSTNTTDSGCCLDSSCFPLESSHIGRSTPISFLSRKRKAYYVENFSSIPSTPQFSSTLNESLMENLEKCHLQNENLPRHLSKETFTSDVSDEHLLFSKISRSHDVKFKSAPSTPEKQITSNRGRFKKANTHSLMRNFSEIGVRTQSPLNKEVYDILYPDLPTLDSQKKSVTPQKIKDRLDKSVGLAKKCLFSLSKRDLFKKIVSNPIIMSKILKELSNGDLYRLSQVSKPLESAILYDINASERFKSYMKGYYSHKENYKITPPSSPEKDESEVGSLSPSSRKHQDFWKMASELNKNQHLIKCPMCDKPSVVENAIAYCQAISCGYIHCRKCNSFAYNPKDFKDKCNNIYSRSLLGDLSNSATSGYNTDTNSSFFSSPFLSLNASSKMDISAVFSECVNSTPRQNVKRNLSRSFIGSSKRKIDIFAVNNRTNSPEAPKTPYRNPLVPKIPLTAVQNNIDNVEVRPSSPPTKQYAACSKQSKRNLKRLTH